MADRRKPSAGSPVHDSALAGLRFLVVDDNPLTRELLCEGLRAGGSAVLTEAASLAEALQVLKDSKVDAVVVNAGLAGAGGLAFVRRLRANPEPRVARLPCLMVSGTFRDELEAEQGPAGYALYVARRFAAERLCRHVLRAMAIPAEALGIESWLGLDTPESQKLVPKPRLRRSLLDLLRGKPAKAKTRTKVQNEDPEEE